jgi:tRNA1(Val) A37 N6-methylase TrmN6
MSLLEIGQRLRALGLTPRALATWAGTDRLSLFPIEGLAAKEPTPAALALALFVTGRDVPRTRLDLPLDEMSELGLVDLSDGMVHAEVAILPAGPSLVVCDRHDAPPTTERVCWPDDSSYHLANAIPHTRVGSWLDLGCSSAFAPLVRPEAAASIVGVELNALATSYAALGIGMSGVRHVTVEHGDLADAAPVSELVTCNAPIPDGVTGVGAGIEMWRHTDDALFERLWRVIPERLAPGGRAYAIVHAAVAAMPLERLAGDRRVVIYTPPDVAPAFGLLWWSPDGEDHLAISHRALTEERPHLDDADRGACRGL